MSYYSSTLILLQGFRVATNTAAQFSCTLGHSKFRFLHNFLSHFRSASLIKQRLFVLNGNKYLCGIHVLKKEQKKAKWKIKIQAK